MGTCVKRVVDFVFLNVLKRSRCAFSSFKFLKMLRCRTAVKQRQAKECLISIRKFHEFPLLIDSKCCFLSPRFTPITRQSPWQLSVCFSGIRFVLSCSMPDKRVFFKIQNKRHSRPSRNPSDFFPQNAEC